MYLYGASGHGMVILDILEANGIPVEGFIDDNPALDELLDHPVYHGKNDAEELIISIGSNRVRKMLAEKLPARFLTAVHPSAIISPRASIGEGSVVMQGAVVQTCATIGRHCIINTGASVDHECRIADYVHLSPHSTLCGNVSIGEGTWVGAGSTIIQGINVGKWSIIGAGTVVTKDIPDGVLVVGNPGRIIKNLPIPS